MKIIDETEVPGIVVVNQRSYVVPKDVFDAYEVMRLALKRISNGNDSATMREWANDAIGYINGR